MKVILILTTTFALCSTFAQAQKKSARTTELPVFKIEEQPTAPDYSQEKCWASLPYRKDAADFTRNGEKWVSDSLKAVDVFYIYPTMYKEGETWCADITDKKLNKRIETKPIRYQASIFNEVGRVYVPRYRQGIIQSFFDSTGSGKAALWTAYGDIKQAFEYYMAHYNQGRPIIIASHSQGTAHARQLLKDYFDSPETKAQLVCAYIVGFSVYPDWYKVLEPCENAKETNCYVTWASFKEGFHYDFNTTDGLCGDVCINPISWARDTVSASGQGGVLLNLHRKKPYACDARIKENYLWVKTTMPVVNKWNILHLIDFNLFWHDIRKNAALRVQEYLGKEQQAIGNKQ